MGKKLELTGMRFGRLLVLKKGATPIHGHSSWVCRCDCGNEITVMGCHLTTSHTKSCGCLQLELTNGFVPTHGESKSRLYAIWKSMKGRCERSTDPRFADYGGRNIFVCEEWRNNYESFRNWAVANGYSDKLTLDRIDNDKGYCPDNCRWATQKEQANNKRSNHYIEFNGERKTLQEWANTIGMTHSALIRRLQRWGSVEEALTIPKGGKQKWGLN